MKRIVPAIGLFFLTPAIAEFLLGDIPVTAIVGLALMAPMYGGGALLIREVSRRAGWGWPSIVALAAAYGFVEEGVATQSLFNPGYAGKHLLSYGHLPLLGMGASWTAFVIGLHTVWSITVPIVCAEALVRDRRRTPWLGRVGLGVTAGVFVAGVALMAALTYSQSRFVASPAQFAGVGVVVVALVALAVALGRRPRRSVPAAGGVPSPWLLGALSLVVTSAVTSAWYLAKDVMRSGMFVTLVAVTCAVALLVLARLSRRSGWRPAHEMALASGALLTYAWQGFVTSHMLFPATPAVQMASHVLFGLGALVLITVATVRLRQRETPRTEARSGSGEPREAELSGRS